jgi:hypothetical protein
MVSSYNYLVTLSVPIKVIYATEDSFPLYYVDREELIDFLINNNYESQKLLNIIGAVQCIVLSDDSIGLYISDVERSFKEYFRTKGN